MEVARPTGASTADGEAASSSSAKGMPRSATGTEPEWFSMLMRHAPTPISITGEDGGFLAANRAACEFLGLPLDRLLRLRWRDVLHPQDVPADQANTALLRVGRSDHFSLPTRFLRADGMVVAARTTVVAIRDRPAPARYVRQVSDLPGQGDPRRPQDRERELRMAEPGHRAVLANLPVGVVIDSSDRVLDANPTAQRILGMSLDEMERLHGPYLGHARTIRPDGTELPPDEHPSQVARRTGRPVRDVVMGIQRRDADPTWLLVSAQPVAGRAGRGRDVVTTFSDITALKAAETRLVRQAMHDPLTGLPNRALLLEHVSTALRRHDRTGVSLALLFVDLDGFKAVNDEAGHLVGDEILRLIAQRLMSSLRASDIAGRIGGDEFLIICEGAAGDDTLEALADRVLEVLPQPLRVGAVTCTVGASIGIAPAFPGTSPEELVQKADAAMYEAKRLGGNRYVKLDPPL